MKDPQCIEIECTKAPACTLTILVDVKPELGSVPGNGRLVHLQLCTDCAAVIREELLLAATDSTEFVCTIPYVMPPLV